MVSPSELAAELRSLRIEMDLSQEEMARRFDVTLRTYQRWETGHGVRGHHLQLARTWPSKARKRRGT